MIRINLLPYRNALRQRQILQHIAAALGVVALAAVIGVGMHMYASSTLSGLQNDLAQLKQRNQMLRKKIGEIRNLDKLRADVQAKLKVVDQLQEGRFRSLNTLIALSRAIPDNVWVTEVKDGGGSISLKGVGESNKAVANFMRALDREPVFADVRLQVIKRDMAGAVPVRVFSLSMRRVEPPAGKSGKKKGGAS